MRCTGGCWIEEEDNTAALVSISVPHVVHESIAANFARTEKGTRLFDPGYKHTHLHLYLVDP